MRAAARLAFDIQESGDLPMLPAMPPKPSGKDSRQSLRLVKLARAKLAESAGGKISYTPELLDLYARNQINMSLIVPVLAMIFAIASLMWSTPGAMLVWLGITFTAQAFMFSTCRRMLRLSADEIDPAKWGRHLTFAEFLIGLSWAMFIGLVWHPNDIANHFFIFAQVIIIVSIRLMLASYSLPIVYAGTVPLISTITILFVMRQDALHFSLAGVVCGTGIFFLILAHKVHQTARSMIEFRAQKDALIAELEESNAKSDATRRQAEDASLAKSRFLATMSHELRTPLNAIMGFSDVMKNEMMGPLGNTVYKDYAHDIHQSGSHLLGLINEILDLSRIEAGRYELHDEVMDISEVGQECLRLLKLRARKRGIALRTQFAHDLPLIHADRKAIRQIWLNLLSNAVKFTPSGGVVLMATKTLADGSVSLAVRDTGIGIHADEVDQVLSPFGQGAIPRKQAEDGAGLGLPIVNGLAELHQASLSIRSRIRVGTEVAVIFPPQRVVSNDMRANGPLGRELKISA